ncbi:MAG TPA: biotin--[acetyl-CoA-carboxylase] ligase [Candidatus Omnitrophica bacterium]|nr:biotin--[acetyl-CoA-carboxylase] ligase [Candidatus Omnitrophota bacterium]
MQDKILEFLKKKEEYVSGDHISHRLGISRQALWKHIQELKDDGYDIIAVPHLGYRLISSPDRLYPFEIRSHLDTRFVGRQIHYFDIVSSTMNMAMELAMSGAPEGAIVVAETQTKGRGRLGRSWVSPKYKGIYVSLILRPNIPPSAAPLLTLLAGVSVCEAIKDFTGLDAQIKWPNDIFIHNKKAGGILTELNAEMDATRFVSMGIGLNVNHDKKIESLHATSLKEQKREDVSRVGLLQELLSRIETNYLLFCQPGRQAGWQKGTSVIIEKWRNYSLTLGKRVRIAYQKTHLEGEAVDIDADGGLLIRTDTGTVEKVMSGDIIHCR